MAKRCSRRLVVGGGCGGVAMQDFVSGLGTLSRETKTRRALFSRRASRHQIWRWRWRWMSRCGWA
ncbi:uncharacterized protein K444DRAFT_7897 [Hyaloscypha bicolor E]|uniref:Uncharacterized protein n=1 Tax=Hyaloscypha bicolor E TaxID=1095630 RepID=A0A2J6TVX1_9HELO|nr:uncharacterized protein K444DRAFT_7897 [Hyaloscypha bicolor E]PMD67182.1 hypothetical protein K444DRAFT_7897 [Hyaloscypha bicolor E]